MMKMTMMPAHNSWKSINSR
uniref:Uncharacterized protein n=1 Tax=Arundo donax TaxID=35708 RepID=A0A0A9BLM7_ARUDO